MIKYLFIGCMTAALAACGGGGNYVPQPQVAASGVQMVQQPEDHTLRDGLIGGALGFMAGRATANAGVARSAPPVIHHTTVVNRTVVQKKIVNVQRPPQRYNPPPRSGRR